MSKQSHSKHNHLVKFTFEGPDKKGIISHITRFFYENNCNINDIDQRLLEDYLIMNTVVDCTDVKKNWDVFIRELNTLVHKTLQMKYRFQELTGLFKKNIALLVTKEDHCALKILQDIHQGKINGSVVCVIGNHDHLKHLGKEFNVPFYHVPSLKKKEHESKVLSLLDHHKTDLVVLARYMQILSPDFVFKYEGRIINIHPSLLPAFPGAKSYHQAFDKGVDYVGVTSHFVTTNLDEGPIICQSAFKINKAKDTLADFIKQGRKHEAVVLTKAVKLFCADHLSLRRGKVVIDKQANRLDKITRSFYS